MDRGDETEEEQQDCLSELHLAVCFVQYAVDSVVAIAHKEDVCNGKSSRDSITYTLLTRRWLCRDM